MSNRTQLALPGLAGCLLVAAASSHAATIDIEFGGDSIIYYEFGDTSAFYSTYPNWNADVNQRFNGGTFTAKIRLVDPVTSPSGAFVGQSLSGFEITFVNNSGTTVFTDGYNPVYAPSVRVYSGAINASAYATTTPFDGFYGGTWSLNLYLEEGGFQHGVLPTSSFALGDFLYNETYLSTTDPLTGAIYQVWMDANYLNYTYTPTAAVVPVPPAAALFASALAALGWVRRSRLCQSTAAT